MQDPAEIFRLEARELLEAIEQGLLDLADRQDLLDQPDGRTRLRRELSVLRREAVVLRTLRAAPAPELARAPQSSN